MPVRSHVQHAYTTGEINPRLIGRYDIERMQSAVETMRNWLPTKHGPAHRRSGTVYAANTHDDDDARLLPFVVSDDDQYILELTPGTIRFYSDDGQLYSSVTVPTEITASQLTANNIFEIRTVQADDVLFLAGLGGPLRTLTRIALPDTANASWSWGRSLLGDGPFLDRSPEDIEISCLPSTRSVGETVVVTVETSGVYPFRATDANATTEFQRTIRVFDGTRWWWGRITAVSDQDGSTGNYRVADVEVRRAFTSQPDTVEWRLGAFSDTTGWPIAIALYQDRLWLAGGTIKPNRVYASRIGRYSVFSPDNAGNTPITDDSGITHELNSEKQERITHFAVTSRGLAAHSSSSMFVLQGETANGPITPGNISSSRQHTRGSNRVTPITIDNELLHVDVTGTRLWSARYGFDYDSWKPEDISLFSDHFLRDGITAMSYQQSPEPVVWMATGAASSNLVSMTYEPNQGVLGWAGHNINGEVLSIATIRTDDLDRVWMVVKRGLQRHVEFLSHPFGIEPLSSECICLDSAVIPPPVTGTTVAVGTRLNGLSVYVVVNQTTVYGPLVVSGGNVTVPVSLTSAAVYAGFAYNSDLVLLPTHVVGREPTHHKKVRPAKVFVRVRTARDLLIGGSLTTLYTIPQTVGSTTVNGFFEVEPSVEIARDATLAFRQSAPWPTMLQTVGMEVEVGGA